MHVLLLLGFPYTSMYIYIYIIYSVYNRVNLFIAIGLHIEVPHYNCKRVNRNESSRIPCTLNKINQY